MTEMNRDPTLANPLSVTRDAGKTVKQGQGGATYNRMFGRVNANLTGFVFKRDLTNPTTAAYIELHRWAWGTRGTVGTPVMLGARTLFLTGGFDAQWQHDSRINKDITQTTLTRDQLEQVTEFGPFIQASIDPVRSLTLTAGARYDRNNFSVTDYFLSDGDDSGVRDMSSPSGTVGLVYHAKDFLVPYANVGTSFETPTTTELANRPTGPGGFNPILDPQKAVNYEVGFRGGVPAGGQGRVDYSVAVYRANITGELIPFETPGDPGRRFYRNAGSSRHQGIEMGAGVQYAWFSLRGGYTYSNNKFEDYRVTAAGVTTVYDGNEEPGVPHNYFRGMATARSRYGWISIEQTASSSYFVNDGNTTRNAGWLSTAVRVGLEIPISGWVINPFGSVENLFDKQYAASVQVNAANGRYFEPSPWRNGYLGIEIRPR
jgi:iron complex outermembrane receptor protein